MQPIDDSSPSSTGVPPHGWTDPDCPVARTLDLVGDRWSLLIVRDAMDGASSFGDFLQRTGIARNILSDRLRRLVEHGVLERTTAPSGRRRTYRLTEAGRRLFPVIVALRQWGEGHAFAAGEQHSTLRDDDGEPVPELHLQARDGRELTLAATHVEKVARSAGS